MVKCTVWRKLVNSATATKLIVPAADAFNVWHGRVLIIWIRCSLFETENGLGTDYMLGIVLVLLSLMASLAAVPIVAKSEF